MDFSNSPSVLRGPASKVLSDYYRCPVNLPERGAADRSGPASGFFRLGADTICYGTTRFGKSAVVPVGELHDAIENVKWTPDGIELPFDPQEVVENLHRERYTTSFRQGGRARDEILRKAYYTVRPILGVAVRRHLQKLYLRGWRKIPFPAWPVDTTLERFHQRLLLLSLQAQNLKSIPFIWFWPEGFSSCAIMTHDVEGRPGKDFCTKLMDLDESFGFRSSFQVIPENRYPVSKKFLNSITSRGFEVNVHDLTHDGRLYAEHAEFRRRAQRINSYVNDFQAQGFRSGILHRNADWYDAFEFSYDMSIPNVAHLDPQRGGCCTVMPYFVGQIVELPVTCTQDYTLFQILKDYSLDLWKRQISLIREQHGLISFIVHPDYLGDQRAQDTYKELLSHLTKLKAEGSVWAALPRDVATWWRERSKMELIQRNGEWVIVGAGNERARVAYAYVAGDGVEFTLCPKGAGLQNA